jgi:hypothetical protein
MKSSLGDDGVAPLKLARTAHADSNLLARSECDKAAADDFSNDK